MGVPLTSLPEKRLRLSDLPLDFAGMLQSSPLPSVVVRCDDHRIVYANPAFIRAFPDRLSKGHVEASICDLVQADEVSALELLLTMPEPASPLPIFNVTQVDDQPMT